MTPSPTAARLATLALLTPVLGLLGTISAAPAEAAPGNDNLSHAAPLALGATALTDTSDSTLEDAEFTLAAPCGNVANSVWYVFTAPTSGLYDLQSVGGATNVDTILDVYSATTPVTFSGLRSVACNNDGGVGYHSEAVLNATGGATYLVRVGNNVLPTDPTSVPGPIGVLATAASTPANDSLATPTPIAAPGSAVVDTTLASDGPSEIPSQGDCDPLHKTVWLAWTSAVNGTATALTSDAGDQPDTELAVWTGPTRAATTGALTSVDCDDDANDDSFTSSVTFPVTKGTTYYLEAGTADPEDAGAFQVTVRAPDPATSATSKLHLKLPKHGTPGQRIKAIAKVKVNGAPATGTVVFTYHGRALRPMRLKGGIAKIHLPALSTKGVTVVATYSGSETVQGSSVKKRIRPAGPTASHHHH